MAILKRERKDGSTAYRVMLRPAGGKTIVRTFADPGDASMFEQMISQKMKATKLRDCRNFSALRKMAKDRLKQSLQASGVAEREIARIAQ